jgi:hypothetical protein
LFVRELKASDASVAGEHCHGLLHLPDAVDDTLILRAVSRDIDAQLQANKDEAGIAARMRYLQKQRDGQAEGWLKLHRVQRYPRERPAPLIGARWSLTRGLKALVAADAKRSKVYPVRLVVNAVVAAPEVRYRDSLFDDVLLPVLAAPQRLTVPPRKRDKILPPSLPLAYPPSIADLLAGLGPTHEAIAERLGLSRPQVTNVIVGRFGIGRPVARRVLELARAA